MKLPAIYLSAVMAFFYSSGCHKTAESESSLLAPAKLPEVVLGEFHGLLGISEGEVLKKAYANATCSVAAVGERYRLVFSGGTPAVGPDIPALDKLLFVVTPGSQQGVFQTVARDGSVEGITISAYMTNLNIDIPQAGGRLIYTGTK